MADRINIRELETWLGRSIEGFSGPLTVSRFSGGQSNPTFLLKTPERRFVLRKKPDGELLPSAHAVDREYRVMTALRDTGVPVPATLGFCDDLKVVGTPFLIMTHVEGRIFWNPLLPELSPRERAALWDDANRVIASLHGVDPEAVGLGDFGRRGHYLSGRSRDGANSISLRRPCRSRGWTG